MSYNVQGAKPVYLVDDAGNSYSATASGGGGALDASFQQVTANGALGALNASLVIAIGRRSTLTLHATGTFVGTITLQGSLDAGTTWVNLNATATWVNLATGAYTTTITAAGIYQASVTGLTSVRVVMSAYTSGSANVYLVASDEPAGVGLDQPIPPGGNTIGNVNVTGSGGVTATKASGTAPVTTDIAAVVTQSPNYVGASNAGLITIAATTNATSFKASAGNLFQIDVSNPGASIIYVKLFNKASAPVLGTDIPIVVIPVAATSFQAFEFGQYGKRFTTGIAAAVTGAITDADATAVAAGGHVGATFL